ncbi:MAG: hypothetical protein IKT40_01140 [Bacilli bacterium]|nr:hypothetical protein [Bacilli bacterium]
MTKLSMINGYTPVAEFAGNVINGLFTVRFDKLPVLQEICTVVSSAGEDITKDFEKPIVVDAEFGACLVLKGSAAISGTATVQGYDYLGQAITEKVTLSGTTEVSTKKAFKFVEAVTVPAADGVSVTVTRKLVLGLPYRTSAILTETRDGVKATTTTLTVPVNVKQSDTTGDPRGTINLTTYTTPANVVLICIASPEIFTIDDKKVGGLFGIPHFSV